MRFRRHFTAPRPLLVVVLVAFLATFAAPVFATKKTEVDVAGDLPPVARSAIHLARIDSDPALRALGSVSQVDDRFGVPTFVWSSRSAPTGSGAVTSPRSPDQIARTHLRALAPLYGMSRGDVETAQVRYVRNSGRGGIVISFRQNIDGIDVWRDEVKLLMDRSLNLIAASGYIASRSDLGEAGTFAFRLSDGDALARALEDFSGGAVDRGAFQRVGHAVAGYRSYDVTRATPSVPTENIGPQPARVKPVLFHEPGSLRPAYYIELMSEAEAYAYVISAADGAILFRHNLTESDSYTYRVWADDTSLHTPFDGPQGNDASPHPTGTPDTFDPPLLLPGLQTLQNGPISTNDPWLPPASTETAGNNVDAYADLNAPDGLTDGDFRATTTSTNTFDRIYDTALPPSSGADQQMATITQLFYTNNYFHDWYYDAGFTEAAGNAQMDNYGRGGVGGDPLHAEAEDYSGTANANMRTPADGGSPREQVYVFPSSVHQITINPPSPDAGDYGAGVSGTFGPQVFDLTADVVLVEDGIAPTTNGCETPFANAAALSGKIAFIDRDTCGFIDPVKNAQDAGAIGVIIGNNVAGVVTMGGVDPTIVTPVLSVSLADAQTIKAQLGAMGVVNVRMVRGPALVRDGSLDNQIVAHEWGHYISNRIIGDGAGLTTIQSRGLGEGWGDFHALLMTVRAEDAFAPANTNYTGVYAFASHALSINIAPDAAYYFGFRRVPYSTDLTKNGFTFKHITNGQPLPPVPTQPNGAPNAAVHNIGEVWCTMLWECYAALLNDTGRITFDEARTRMRDYLVSAYMMTPNTPTFTEARDAVLASALAYDLADYHLFCAAFAKRGAGTGAISPDRGSTTMDGVVESFACGGDLEFVSQTITENSALGDNDSYIDNGEAGTVTLTLRNVGSTDLSHTTATLSSTNPHVSFPNGNVMVIPPSPPFSQTAGTLSVALSGAVGVEVIDIQITYDDPGLHVPGPRATPPLDDYGNADEVPSTTESVEAHTQPWTITGVPGDPDARFRRVRNTGRQHDYRGPDNGAKNDQYLISPPLQVAPVGTFSFSFSQSYEFEDNDSNIHDGGVLELSSDDGSTWVDIGAFAVPTYGTTPISMGSGNPIAGRLAYGGTSPGYPAFHHVNVDVGAAYNGMSVRVRFREGQNTAAGAHGWDIDDITFSNLTNQPFRALIPDDVVTPVLLVRFDATPGPQGGIAVRWSLVNLGEFTSIVVERAEARTGPWSAIAADQVQERDVTVAVDRTAESGRDYWYRLVVSAGSGTQAVFGPVQGTAEAPHAFELAQSWPNPTAGPMQAEFAVARQAKINLSVIDLQGRVVRMLASGVYSPGRYHATWDGRLENGERVPVGVYFLRFQTPEKDVVTRIAVSR